MDPVQFARDKPMSAPAPAITARQKIELLKEIQEFLLLPPEQYRLLIIHVLRQHTRQRQGERGGPAALYSP